MSTLSDSQQPKRECLERLPPASVFSDINQNREARRWALSVNNKVSGENVCNTCAFPKLRAKTRRNPLRGDGHR